MISTLVTLLRGALCLSIVALLAACPSLGPRAGLPPTVDRAETFAQRGEHAAAAREFERLAELAALPRDGARLRLRAVQEWLAAERPDAAAATLGAVPVDLDDPTLRTQRALAEIHIQYLRNQDNAAWQAITALPIPEANPPRR
ncbi:MAG: hypothetical protein NZM12_01200, partial [Steroidobacteraceae bacterium]|nr:hypothetical protein [Steroidobacteraceae bacterium]MDW8258080.1 hypothetical protein [Gammaproteobacteria bacterium]